MRDLFGLQLAWEHVRLDADALADTMLTAQHLVGLATDAPRLFV
jgi:hypothetical protein